MMFRLAQLLSGGTSPTSCGPRLFPALLSTCSSSASSPGPSCRSSSCCSHSTSTSTSASAPLRPLPAIAKSPSARPYSATASSSSSATASSSSSSSLSSPSSAAASNDDDDDSVLSELQSLVQSSSPGGFRTSMAQNLQFARSNIISQQSSSSSSSSSPPPPSPASSVINTKSIFGMNPQDVQSQQGHQVGTATSANQTQDQRRSFFPATSPSRRLRHRPQSAGYYEEEKISQVPLPKHIIPTLIEKRSEAILKLEELLPVVSVSISVGQMERAQQLFDRLMSEYPDAMRQRADVNLFNSMIEGWFQQPDCEFYGFKMFQRMTDLNVQPNESTFAILLRGCIQLNNQEEIQKCLAEMDNAGYNLKTLAMNPRIPSNMVPQIQKNVDQYLIKSGKASAVGTDSGAMQSGTETAAERENDIDSDAEGDDEAIEGDELSKEEAVLGLRSLREAMGSLNSLPNSEVELFRLQEQIERDAVAAHAKRMEEERIKRLAVGVTSGFFAVPDREKLNALKEAWIEAMVPAIEKELSSITKKKEGFDREVYGPFLRLFPPSLLAQITVSTFIDVFSSTLAQPWTESFDLGTSVRGLRLVITIGKNLETEYLANRARKIITEGKQKAKLLKIDYDSHRLRTYLKALQQPKEFSGQERSKMAREISKDITKLGFDEDTVLKWTNVTHIKVGSILAHLLMDTAYIESTGSIQSTRKSTKNKKEEVEEEADHFDEKFELEDNDETEEVTSETIRKKIITKKVFTHGYVQAQTKRIGVITAVEEFIALMSKKTAQGFNPRMLPMIIPSIPWTSIDRGGYLTVRHKMLRIKGEVGRDSSSSLAYLRRAQDGNQLARVFQGLDVLGETGWIVDEKNLEIMTKMYEGNVAISGVPPIVDLTFNEPEPPANATVQVKNAWYKQRSAIQNKNRDYLGRRCDMTYRLEIAKKFVGVPMYYPHCVDFRGRAYPISPHFNHIGSDLSRGLMKFHVGKPLGHNGLRWMKIHLANLFGYDKVAWIESKWDEISKTVDDPVRLTARTEYSTFISNLRRCIK